jgi:hypothetical protein
MSLFLLSSPLWSSFYPATKYHSSELLTYLSIAQCSVVHYDINDTVYYYYCSCEVDLIELRLASINLLLSMIGLPLHFLNQPLPGTEDTVLCTFMRKEREGKAYTIPGSYYIQ